MAVAFRPIWQASFPPSGPFQSNTCTSHCQTFEVSETAGMAAREVKQFRQDRQRTRMASISLIGACGMVSDIPRCALWSRNEDQSCPYAVLADVCLASRA
jgi:hypothetical protein